MPGPQVECLLCYTKFGLSALESGLYQITTMICSNCYKRMQEQPVEQSCFGKPTIVDQKGKLLQRAYHPDAVECQKYCPDKNICKTVLLGEQDESTSE